MTRYRDYRQRALHQAMAWSVVYFLRRSRVVKSNPTWGKVVDIYFQVLRAEHARLTEGLAADARGERFRAEARARAAADEAAFRGVNLAALKKEWKKFVLKLPPPRK